MRTSERTIRQSVSFPSHLARRIKTLARARRTSASRVITELVESGLGAQERERERFLELADRLTRETDRAEQQRLKEELARLTFGE
jgi:metal-responsive CopG/Arc/MetJ family transcriptional regulator